MILLMTTAVVNHKEQQTMKKLLCRLVASAAVLGLLFGLTVSPAQADTGQQVSGPITGSTTWTEIPDGILVTTANDPEYQDARLKPGVAHNPFTGKWYALLVDTRKGPKSLGIIVIGEYSNEEAAWTAAKFAARKANRVIDGPACDSPIVVC